MMRAETTDAPQQTERLSRLKPFAFRRAFIFCLALSITLALTLYGARRILSMRGANIFFSNRNESASDAAIRRGVFPPVMLWAWERPEDLSFINPNETGVAFLSKTILLRGDEVVAKPRLQTLRVPEDAPLMAVVRIETTRAEGRSSRGGARPTLSDKQRAQTVAELVSACRRERVRALQIDFDATRSEREFYRALIFDVRRALPADVRLSITALASWCIGDLWLEDLPIDEAAPMLFRMGVERKNIKNFLASGDDFESSKCKGRAGISLDEPNVQFPAAARVYVFNPRAWTRETVNDALSLARKKRN